MELLPADGPGALLVTHAVPADAPAMLALHRKVLEEGMWFITEPDELRETIDSRIAMIREATRGDSSVIFVARRRASLVGWAHLAGGPRRRTRHVGRLECMVDPAHRRRGVGAALLSAIVGWAEQHPVIAKISLQVYTHNEAAVGLYRRFGFVEEGRRVGEYRFADGSLRDDLLMARWVKPV